MHMCVWWTILLPKGGVNFTELFPGQINGHRIPTIKAALTERVVQDNLSKCRFMMIFFFYTSARRSSVTHNHHNVPLSTKELFYNLPFFLRTSNSGVSFYMRRHLSFRLPLLGSFGLTFISLSLNCLGLSLSLA